MASSILAARGISNRKFRVAQSAMESVGVDLADYPKRLTGEAREAIEVTLERAQSPARAQSSKFSAQDGNGLSRRVAGLRDFFREPALLARDNSIFTEERHDQSFAPVDERRLTQ